MTGQDDEEIDNVLQEQFSKADNYPVRFRKSSESIRFSIDPESGHPGMHIPRELAGRAFFEERFMWMMKGYYQVSDEPPKKEH